MKFAPWNSLPAKKEDKEKILKIFSLQTITPMELVKLSSLSKTRCLCGLDELIYENLVTINKNGKLVLTK